MATEIIPYIEASSARPADVELAIEGLRIWASVPGVRQAVVTSEAAPGGTDVIRKVAAAVRRLRIIPGLKTSVELRAKFDDPQAWRRVWDRVAMALKITGGRTVLFEHESAIEPYLLREQELDLIALSAGLRWARAHWHAIWYPTVRNPPDQAARGLVVVGRVQADLDVTFVDHARLYGPGAPSDPGTRLLVEGLERTALRVPIPMIYCDYQGGRPMQWPREQIGRALELAGTPAVLLNPTQSEWIATAKWFAGNGMK